MCGCDTQNPVTCTTDEQRRPGATEAASLHRTWRRTLRERLEVGGEEPLQLGDRGGQLVGAGAERFPVDARLIELPLHVAGAEADLQPPASEDVGGGHLAGQQRRVPERDVEHQCAHPQPCGCRCRRDEQRKRRGSTQVVGGQDGVVAVLLGSPALVDECVTRADTKEVAREPEHTHDDHPAC